ncbi:MAG TPA: RNA polymerase sigma factor [Candidatus Gemmiger avicola]|uniref:RNA polymerase sigma factor n=1 Tax=Candidatus Gemmiger avicola TaxID=2838605 RepID=A0A9D2M5Q8_9FIRM|nr:RNA polymerase sigma factor [Candidatus Gemmiger avicola]
MDFEQVYQTYFKSVYRYIRRLSGDEQLAEEITSETFVQVMRSIGTFRGDCDLRVWICQIAKNTYYTHLKKQNRVAALDEEAWLALADPAAPVEERLDAKEDAQRIRALLHTLPEPYKEVFMWRTLGELSFAEIGALYGKTANWACVTYHRARQQIKTGMEEPL